MINDKVTVKIEEEHSYFAPRICVIGLGQIGLPLARLFSTKYKTKGFDLDPKRVEELMKGYDSTLEIEDDLLQKAIDEGKISKGKGLACTANIFDIRTCNFYVITVHTPVDKKHNRDLHLLLEASEIVGNVISGGNIVVYNSSVCPKLTKNECIPVIERVSGLNYNRDFFAGHCSESINPGKIKHIAKKTAKVASGSTPEIEKIINEVYSPVIISRTPPYVNQQDKRDTLND